MTITLHGQSKDALAKTKKGAWKYDVVTPGYKCNMTDIQAAIGLVELDRYAENLERRKGQYYWKNKTLCGSNEPGDDQFSLIRAYREFIIPEMEKIQLKESEGGRFRVVFMEQEDGAGCHTSAEYQKFKEDEFTNRNWLRLRQSPQSPLFNVNDRFYFRKLSKEISSMQSLTMGTRLIKSEETMKIVDQVER